MTQKVFITNNVVGEFFIATSNYCNMLILANELTETNAETNLIYSATNYISYTNSSRQSPTPPAAPTSRFIPRTSSPTPQTTSSSPFRSPAVGTNISLREGINTMQFVRRDYDSLLNRFWSP